MSLLLQTFSTAGGFFTPKPPPSKFSKKCNIKFGSYPYVNYCPGRSVAFSCIHGARFDDIAAIAQNKVLVAAAVSAAIGQLSKPFTSALLYGNTFDFKAAVQAGGLPSTHSSAAVATAMSLGLERGFSDSIFGLTVVYASLIMYDAQGVRRAVGNHAKTINRLIHGSQVKIVAMKDGEDVINSDGGKSSSGNLDSLNISLSGECDNLRKPTTAGLSLDSNVREGRPRPELIVCNVKADRKMGFMKASKSCFPLNESVGHTEVEVVAGALLGFFVSLMVYASV